MPHGSRLRSRLAGWTLLKLDEDVAAGVELGSRERLRREVLGLLVRREAILPPLAGQMLAWRHSGFTVHNQVRVAAGDAEGRKSLAGYMLRAPFSLEKTTYDAARGMVIYRSKLLALLKTY